jgi:uncharacterized membrane protein YqjE
MALEFEQEAVRPEPRPGDSGGRAVGALVRELVDEASALVRAEAELARTEIRENVAEAKRGVASLAGGAAVVLVGFMALVAAVILLLALALPAWLSALIVGVIVAGAGVAMLMWGRSKTDVHALKPERTIRSLGQDRQLARDERERIMESRQ